MKVTGPDKKVNKAWKLIKSYCLKPLLKNVKYNMSLSRSQIMFQNFILKGISFQGFLNLINFLFTQIFSVWVSLCQRGD